MSFGFIDFAKDVLKASDSPLSVEEMWEAGCNLGLDEKLGSSGKTPIRTLSARIYVDIKNNTDSVFIQVSKRPAKFFLKGKDIKSEKDIPESEYITKHTSGSTGTPFKMVMDKYKHARWIAGNKELRAIDGVQSHEKTMYMYDKDYLS